MNALPINKELVTYNDLCTVTGESKPERVVVWLANNQVPYFLGSNKKPFVTVTALNSALGVNSLPINQPKSIEVM